MPRRADEPTDADPAVHRLQAHDAVSHRDPHDPGKTGRTREAENFPAPSHVEVRDEQDRIIGGFKQKLFSIGGAFTVLDAPDRPICQLQGNWVGWNFRFLDGNRELAHVTKEWGGLGKELLTTADDYILQISDDVPGNDPTRPLILAAVVCIDMVLKE